MVEGQSKNMFFIGQLIFVGVLLLIPSYYKVIPKFAPFSANKSIEQIIPVLHVTTTEAYQLGMIRQRYLECKKSNFTECEKHLDEAGKIVNSDNFAWTYLDFNHKNTTLFGLMSIANTLIVIGVLFLTISIGPIVTLLIAPYILQVLPSIISFLIWLKPCYETFFYSSSLFVMAQSHWYPSSTAMYVAFS